MPDAHGPVVDCKKAGNLHPVLEQAVPGDETAQLIELTQQPGQGVEEKHDMSVRISQISAREDAVHTPVVVDAVHRPDIENFQTVE